MYGKFNGCEEAGCKVYTMLCDQLVNAHLYSQLFNVYERDCENVTLMYGWVSKRLILLIYNHNKYKDKLREIDSNKGI